ncbi:MAG: endonuclease/exonuclease/phosphatase family protein [Candidatus Sumerlaeota bacterium]|nr:endonuclease/exonuclease/phosphatase family protein [Candidatus Sumerlaeota bacterium]
MNSRLLHIAFWNVERCLGPIADAGDLFYGQESQSGEANKQRIRERAPQDDVEMNHKIQALAHVIGDMFDGNGPDIIGLAEVGAEEITSQLKNALRSRLGCDWQEVRSDSIHGSMTSISVFSRMSTVRDLIKIGEFPDIEELRKPEKRLRPFSILVECALPGRSGDFLLSINHWKSNALGDFKDNFLSRQRAASWLDNKLQENESLPCAVVMGDFNSDPYDKHFGQNGKLRAHRRYNRAAMRIQDAAELYNPSWRLLAPSLSLDDFMAGKREDMYPETSIIGSVDHIYDQIMVSGAALLKRPLLLREPVSLFAHPDYSRHLAKQGFYRLVPVRWRENPNNDGCASDHFPICATFEY